MLRTLALLWFLPTSFALTQSTTPPFFSEVALLLIASAAIAFVSFRLGLVPIIGFLLVGLFIGPGGLGLVRDAELINSAAEIGVVLLLLTIGIEFSLERLGRITRLRDIPLSRAWRRAIPGRGVTWIRKFCSLRGQQ